MNPGRRILHNLLEHGFAPHDIHIVKPNATAIDGVQCHPTISSLPDRVDLCVLAVGADRVPSLLAEIVAGAKAESLIVIPGGLGERPGTEPLEREVRARLAASRETTWGGPVMNGGNSLGVRSAPGRYDTTFIPGYKLGDANAPAPLALVSQSGAFAIARWSKLAGLAPRYLISVGNQTDLTVGDYLTYLKDDPTIEIFACYVEGFRPRDGRRWLEAAAEIVRSGRTVILYRAGRTPTGVQAGASHTAAIAGEYVVTRELAMAAGVLVAESLGEFDDFLRLTCLLRDRPPAGMRLGAVTNAGFECVAIGDSLGAFELARLATPTVARLEGLLARSRLADVIDVQHPLDLTPIMDDAGYEEAVRAVLEDEGVDVAVVGCVPLTGALATLPIGAGHAEDLEAADALAARLATVRADSPKAWVGVVDAGSRYDPLVASLERRGIPTFRTIDRALRAFGRYCRCRLGTDSGSREVAPRAQVAR
jgi:acyl-CoA synthetase (NDP forming)